jgi:hypothetical protein
MAKVRNNIFLRGLQGDLGGQFYVGTGLVSGRTSVSPRIDSDKERVYSPAQLAQQQAFREAIAYGKAKKGEEIYITRADGTGKSPYNLAVADWFNRPQILEVDLTAWKGASGDVIRLRAQDDVGVTQVAVTISDEEGAVLEAGQATDLGALWWEYTTTNSHAGRLTLTIAARDLPGHDTVYTQVRTLNAA